MSGLAMRGLSIFISDIRNCRTKEAERKRVTKELAKIRQKFSKNTNLGGYDRKKYVTKLLYIHMLGYDIDFGHIEAVTLLSSDRYSEKHMGYLACTLLLDENSEMLTLITNSIAQDLLSRNQNFQCLALTAIANVGGKEFAEALSSDVQKVLVDKESHTVIVKKAALTLLRLFRKYPEVLPADEWSSRVVNLLDRADLGVVTSVASLLVGLAGADSDSYADCVQRVVRDLVKIVLHKEYTADYVYYGIPTPWLQVKLLRLLQYYPPPEDNVVLTRVNEVLDRIVSGTELVKQVNKNNAMHAVLFEAVNVIITYGNNRELLSQAVTVLGRYVSAKDANLKYLSLESIARLAMTAEADVGEQLKKHQETILSSLKDPDISIRRRALDVLYCLCDKSNALDIVRELLNYLQVADFNIREELVLKIALLAEKFADDFRWYVDVVLQLVHSAGDFVGDDVWYRVVQIVTNNENLQKYATRKVFDEVNSSGSHEIAVKLAGYIIGEYGDSISTEEGYDAMTQFNTLHNRFTTASLRTRALLLSCYGKMYNVYKNLPELRSKISSIFNQHEDSLSEELQQRAVEYSSVAKNEPLMVDVFEMMPFFPDRESSVLKKIKARQGDTVDKTVWKAAKDFEASEEEGTEKVAEKEQKIRHRETREDNLLDMETPKKVETQKAESAPSKPQDDILDLLDGGSVPEKVPEQEHPPAEASPVAAPTPAQPNMLDDFFGSSGASPSSGDMTNTGVSPQTIQSWYNNLCVQDSGVLFEDERIQIGIKSEYRGYQGRIAFVLGNKTSTNIGKLSVKFEDVPAIRMQHSPVPPMITPRAQVQILAQMICQGVFTDPPVIVVSYESGQEYRVRLQLPVIPVKFAVPLQMTAQEEFFRTWKPIAKANEDQAIFKGGNPIDVGFLERFLTRGMRMHVPKEIDPNAANFVGTASFSTASGQHTVLLRIETNASAQAYRLTVRSTASGLASVFVSVIKNYLSG